MATPNIVMTRIDERLVHGQGQLWIKSLGVNTVIVANDEAAGDKMAQTLMKTVIPGNIAMRFFTLQKTIDIIHKAAPAQRKAAILAMADKGVKFNTKTPPSGADGAAEVDIVEFCRR